MVITCAPCNFGRGDSLLEERGLIDPRSREPVRSSWDGLERILGRNRIASTRRTVRYPNGTFSIDDFLSATPPVTVPFFKQWFSQAEGRGLTVTPTNAGLKIRAPGQPGFLYCYPPSMYKQECSVLEVYLAPIKGTPLAEDLRHRIVSITDVVQAGGFSLRIFVSPDTIDSARTMFEIAADAMERQDSH